MSGRVTNHLTEYNDEHRCSAQVPRKTRSTPVLLRYLRKLFVHSDVIQQDNVIQHFYQRAIQRIKCWLLTCCGSCLASLLLGFFDRCFMSKKDHFKSCLSLIFYNRNTVFNNQMCLWLTVLSTDTELEVTPGKTATRMAGLRKQKSLWLVPQRSQLLL